MNALNGQRILLGITSGIAAYKTPVLVRELKRHGAEVRVVMTQDAKQLVAPLALQAVSGHPVQSSLWDGDAGFAMDHIELARWPSLLLVAPATANHLAKVATGLADDLLSTLLLASNAPVYMAPAMNVNMWESPAVQHNYATLKARGVVFIGPESGEQACGDVGCGRMAEPEVIVSFVKAQQQPGRLFGKKLVITAGPTREALDPMRFISNKSTGYMGYALAQAAQAAGAQVVLVSGPCSLPAPKQVELVSVKTAQEMAEAVMQQMGCDVFIGAAAVADYTPVSVATDKIKKSDDEMVLNLKRTRDIIKEVASSAKPPFTIGFCAETNDLLASARKKRAAKKLDWIVANDISTDAAFGDQGVLLHVLSDACERKVNAGSKEEFARLLMINLADSFQH